MRLLSLAMLFTAFASAILFAACGDDDSDNEDAERTTTSSAGVSGTASADRSPSSSAEAGGDGSNDDGGQDGSGSATPQPGGSDGSGESDGGSSPETPIVASESREFEAAEGNYCDTVSQSSPPNSVIGLLKLNGEDAPAGTEVMVAFDGVPGPTEATTAAGGYRVDFGVSQEDGCANTNGARLTVIVNGREYETGVEVGSAAAFRVDIID